ncbi:DNA-directed RNA polymerase subunit E'' [Candidatus Pacearchaeota archaeon]|nr:DNA-directed RNA polymerase subunit E'' [Candidatus Pacearchaeota archaeon]
MALKVCKNCKKILEGTNKCPECDSEEIGESFKGKISVLNPEQSEVAKNLKLSKKGLYALRIG